MSNGAPAVSVNRCTNNETSIMTTLALLRYAATVAATHRGPRLSSQGQPGCAASGRDVLTSKWWTQCTRRVYYYAEIMIRWLLFQFSIHILECKRCVLNKLSQIASNSDFARSREKITVAGEDDVNRRHRSVNSWSSSTECLLRIRIARGGLIFHLILCTRGITSSSSG